MKQYIPFILSLLIWTSCKQDPEARQQADSIISQPATPLVIRPENSGETPSNDPTTSTFISATNETNPVMVTAIRHSTQRETIMGVTDLSKPMYSRYAIFSLDVDYSLSNRVQRMDSISYGQEFTSIEIIHPFKLAFLPGNKHYLYFASKDNEYGSGAAGLSTLRFNLYSPVTNEIYSLVFDGEDVAEGRVEGDFVNIDAFTGTKEELLYLLKRADTCSYIRKPEEVNIESPAEYAKKWKAENPGVVDVFDARGGEEGSLAFPSYIEAPIPFSEASNIIENDDYTVADFFRGSVFAESKTSGMYYMVWLEGCNHGCEKKISFSDDGKLKITYEVQPITVLIDLKNPAYYITRE
ncbi:hypothetical protein GXP67_00290 [Rhodocytophaga rosea]|uniref:Lipoprotein n=1 Tax=Rhodocytophaga rosea TaxID=2704465 RepID=A0A6C0GBB4_9BACT|nr:hypothetical protein [Rhodocytophaga rosea]QHT65221.1 hypothetical protein GXP67_00290 [Rhodocytophaga rosea]